MKRNFTTGLLSGLLGALLLIGIVGMVYIGFDVKSNQNNNRIQSDLQAEADTEEKGKIQNFDEIVYKLEFLEKLVDTYYLKDVDPTLFADGIYKGFMSSLEDPYSTYYTQKEYTALMESSAGTYCGIGATVTQNVKTGVITIVKPFESGPAYKEGVLPGDILYKVNGDEVTGLDLSDVVSRMKGKENTNVVISVYREGVTDPLEFNIARKKIEVPTIEYKMLDNKIGYIMISEFDEITVNQFINAVDKLEEEKMVGLIVDVRNNPGGLLKSVVKILDRLLPKGLIVYTEDKYGHRQEENAVDSKKTNVPMAVLINGNSASASEIFAGAIQDYGVGTIVGTTSFGKGIVQKVIPLTDGTAVKLTISKYYTPKGRNIHGTGITPDVEVELNEGVKQKVTIPVEQDNQLQEAIKIIKSKQ